MDGEKRIYIGLALVGIVFLAISISFTMYIKNDADLECSVEMAEEGYVCPHSSFFPIESYIGISFSLLLILYGGYKYINHKKIRPKINLSKLKEEEKKIYLLLLDNEGAMFQNEIVKTTGMNKVKVTRVLDKLEAKGLIIRRRRGMTNMIIIKERVD